MGVSRVTIKPAARRRSDGAPRGLLAWIPVTAQSEPGVSRIAGDLDERRQGD